MSLSQGLCFETKIKLLLMIYNCTVGIANDQVCIVVFYIVARVAAT